MFDLFNCGFIQLEGSYFRNNSGTGIVLKKFRGNTGAVAIGYYFYDPLSPDPRVTISNCNFTNNSATGTASDLLSSERTLSNGIFTGRGGAVGIFIGESSMNVMLSMTDCRVIGNYAHLFGGGIYINFTSKKTTLLLILKRIRIIENRAGSGGGGVQLFSLSPTENINHTLIFRQCNFVRNVADSGGGIYVFTSLIGEIMVYCLVLHGIKI